MHIQNLFEQKKEKNYLLDRIGSAHPDDVLALQAIGPVEEARTMKQVVLAWDDFSRYCFVLSAVSCMRPCVHDVGYLN
jgi:hypothetical protein